MPQTIVISRQASELLARIDQRLAAIGKTRYWLANTVTEGKNKGLITDLARKGFIPKEARLRRIAELLAVSVDWLMGRSESPAPVQSEVGLADRREEWRGFEPPENGIPLLGTGDCAELEVCDESGNMVSVERSSFDPDFHVRYLERPRALRGERDLYAIYFHGDSMWPRFKPGEHGIVAPHRPVVPGDEVVVQLSDTENGNEVHTVLVKALVRQNAREVVLRQYNPDLTFTLPRNKIVRMHAILPPSQAHRFAQ